MTEKPKPKLKRKVVLEVGPRDRDPATGEDRGWAYYKVVQAVNVMTPQVLDCVTPEEAQALIDAGIEVVVNAPSRGK